MDDPRIAVFEQRCEQGGIQSEAIQEFCRMYRAYLSGESGKVAWKEIAPAGHEDVVPLGDLESQRGQGVHPFGQLAWIVLNGGLGTSMKMDRAKSLLPVKGGQTFLYLIAEHVVDLRRRWGVQLPVLFMNSFATREDTLAELSAHPSLAVRMENGESLPLDFVQHRFPRLREDNGLPYGDAHQREAWAPPGHGNLYLAMKCSGVLDTLLTNGIRWVFVSNADNLGASPHPDILEFMVAQQMQFAMEVTEKTAADIKGGTLIRKDGRLHLLEIAQVEPLHVGDFQDVGTFPVFNTNNLWMDLRAVADRLASGGMHLPLIVNRKRVGEVPVVQLETAMGAAIGQFERSAGVLVTRDRFAPVKTTNDLLVRRSDVYVRGEQAPLMPNPERSPSLGPPVVVLDPEHYASVPDLDLRIPHAPSLLEAKHFELKGDVRLGEGVRVRGDVRLENASPKPLVIASGSDLSG